MGTLSTIKLSIILSLFYQVKSVPISIDELRLHWDTYGGIEGSNSFDGCVAFPI
jgi:hypothetical protein